MREATHQEKKQSLVDLAESGDAIEFFTRARKYGIFDEGDLRDANLSAFSHIYNEGRRKVVPDQETPVNKVPQTKRKIANPKRYASFLNDAYNCNWTNFESDEDYKVVTLQIHFPNRFGQGGKQDLRDYNAFKVGALFKRMIESSEKMLERHKQN